MTYLITGAAGFIGFHLATELLSRGEKVLGLDNLDPYYDVDLKKARLQQLSNSEDFEFITASVAEMNELQNAVRGKNIKNIIHLAGQAGVLNSIENPDIYGRDNLVGHLNVLEIARNLDGLEHMAYASSSSIYGGRTDLPFLETDPSDRPASLYAATKKANELMSHTYAHLYGIPLTGFRFFTVYGPWGRPDMAYWLFADAILKNETIKMFNHGDMLRDFTYIDDLVSGVLSVCEKGYVGTNPVPHEVYNIGNNKAHKLDEFVDILEAQIGKKTKREYLPMPPGDVPATYADISAIQRDYGFEAKTDLKTGLARFVGWYRQFYGV